MKHLSICLRDKNQNTHGFQYKVTEHAIHRMQQRGINKDMLMFIVLYGKIICKQGLNYYFLTEKNMPDNMPTQWREKLNNQVVLCDEEKGTILTAYHGFKGLIHLRKKRKALKKWAA